MHLSGRLAIFVVRVIVLIALIAPIIVYMSTFGTSISRSDETWSKMGSAMSGIYGPILAFLAFAVLAYQARLQQMTTQLQHETTKHMFDESRLRSMDIDAVFYLARLEAAVQEVSADGRTIREQLKELTMYASLAHLRDPQVISQVQAINREHSRIGPAWTAFQSILGGLVDVDDAPYQLLLSTTTLRATVVLSFEMCVALDNFVWCNSVESLRGPFLFSEQVRLGQLPT